MDPAIVNGVLGGLGAGLATGLGALGVYAVRGLSRKANDVLLCCAAGIMLAATFFSLLAPGIEVALEDGGRWRAAGVVVGGVLLGSGGLAAVHRLVPHEHLWGGREGPDALRVQRVWLFVLAISLHNLPEGMAVGVGFGAGDVGRGLPLALGIGLQNIPEGLAVAAGLVSLGYGRGRSFLISLGTGVLEAAGAAFGAAAAVIASTLLPWALAFAAGAMLFVIVSEILPESMREESKEPATAALIGGFLAMTVLDVVLQ